LVFDHVSWLRLQRFGGEGDPAVRLVVVHDHALEQLVRLQHLIMVNTTAAGETQRKKKKTERDEDVVGQTMLKLKMGHGVACVEVVKVEGRGGEQTKTLFASVQVQVQWYLGWGWI